MNAVEPVTVSVSEFVALLNQTFEYAYPSIIVLGELSNLRISKNKWVYFDLKDDTSSVKCFGTVFMLPGPLEDGILVSVKGQPRLHALYGFSLNVQTIQPSGEGSIKRAAQLLASKLKAEGLFDTSRKRSLPYPPRTIGLITSAQSAAFADFVKILNARWQGIETLLFDVQVQGEIAPLQIVEAISFMNTLPEPPEVLVVIRGGGSPEDLAAFSDERVTRAVAASRIPTLVAIGHEVDISLAELAADQRASTPSNAAELLVPDKKFVLQSLSTYRQELTRTMKLKISDKRKVLIGSATDLNEEMRELVTKQVEKLTSKLQLLNALSPEQVLKRGFAIVRNEQGLAIRSSLELAPDAVIEVQLADGRLAAKVKELKTT